MIAVNLIDLALWGLLAGLGLLGLGIWIGRRQR